MPPKKKKGNAEGKKKKKKNDLKGDKKKTEWDELSTDKLEETVKSMQLKLSEVESRRLHAQAELDMVQQSYSDSLKLSEEADLNMKNIGADLIRLQDQCEIEIRTYHDKTEFLKHIHTVTLQELKESVSIDNTGIDSYIDEQLTALLEAKRCLEKEVKIRDQEREADFFEFRNNLGREFEIFQRQLINEAESLTQELIRKKVEKKQNLRQQLTEEIDRVNNQKGQFLTKISDEHDDCKQHVMSYYDEMVKGQRIKVAKLRARVASLQRERDSDVEMARILATEACLLEKPLSDIQTEVGRLKIREKKRSHNLQLLNGTKSRILEMRRKIALIEQECVELQQSLADVQEEHNNLIRMFDATAVKANQASIGKAEILAYKIKELARAVDADEVQLRRVLNVASLPPGDQEAIVADLHAILDEQKRNIDQLYLKVAQASKDNIELLTKCRLQLCENGYSEGDLSKILGVFTMNDLVA